jgi:hypothetical protein
MDDGICRKDLRLHPITRAIMTGMEKYEYRVPVLAIYSVPPATGHPFKDDAACAAADDQAYGCVI